MLFKQRRFVSSFGAQFTHQSRPSTDSGIASPAVGMCLCFGLAMGAPSRATSIFQNSVAKLSKRVRQLVHLSAIFILCSTFSISCTLIPDPVFEIVKQALQDEHKDPAATYQALKDNLDSVKDKRIIEVLLDYLEKKEE